MFSWLIISLISLTCLLCFISVVQLELKKNTAKVWIFLTCCSIVGVIAAIMSFSVPDIKKYSYEPKKPTIKIKELKVPEVIAVGKKVRVSSSQLSIWKESNFDSEIIGTIDKGEVLKVLTAPANSDWIEIQTGTGLTGWVVKSFVELLSDEPKQQKEKDKSEKDSGEAKDITNAAETVDTVIVKTSILYVRADSNYNAKVLGTVKNGDVLKVIDTPENFKWVKIQTNTGLTGWVSKGLVEFMSDTPKKQEDNE